MKKFHLLLLILKTMLVAQFGLILLDKQTIHSKVYLVTEILFKITLGIFIEVFFYTHTIKDLALEDKLIFSFAGGLLIYDALINTLPDLLIQYGIKQEFLSFSRV